MPATSVALRFCLLIAGRPKGTIGEMHARSHGLVCTLGITHYPSLASAEVAEDSADSGRSLSVGKRAKIEKERGPLRNQRPFLRCAFGKSRASKTFEFIASERRSLFELFPVIA